MTKNFQFEAVNRKFNKNEQTYPFVQINSLWLEGGRVKKCVVSSQKRNKGDLGYWVSYKLHLFI